MLYEMLTGRRLFQGEDAADTMASVIRSDPDLRSLPRELPPRVRELLGRCLEKDPKKRRRDIGDIRAELEAPADAVSLPTPERRTNVWLQLAGATALALAAGFAGWHLKPDAPRQVQRFEMVLPDQGFLSRQAIMAVDVRTEPRLEIGAPELLFEWPIGWGGTQNWDVSPDGQRFVVLGDVDTSQETRPRINVVLNWFSELERLVPTN